MAGGTEDPLKTHRREITVVFLDLRGFTAFAETAEPEEVMTMLGEYHEAMGRLVLEHEGTLERFTGDGMMIFFNDPLPVPNPTERALRMALSMRERVAELSAGWRKRGWDLGLGVGIAQGYATLGAIGFEGRRDYSAQIWRHGCAARRRPARSSSPSGSSAPSRISSNASRWASWRSRVSSASSPVSMSCASSADGRLG